MNLEIPTEEDVRRIVRDELARDERGDDWIDQIHSPLGRRTHCALVRRGTVPGVRLHRRVLIRRRDLDKYIESHRAAPADDCDELAAALARVGGRRA
jgi:hypothetical protein